ADQLVHAVWRPLVPHLDGVHTVLIAPDGLLCGLPFAALPGEAPNSFLVEQWTFGVVVSGRQVLELAADEIPPRAEGFLAVGGLVYGAAPASPEAGQRQAWGELPGTELEVDALVRAYHKAFAAGPAPQVTGGPALEADGLKRLLGSVPSRPRWRYVHLATHGFFEPGSTDSEPAPGSLLSFALERDQRI